MQSLRSHQPAYLPLGGTLGYEFGRSRYGIQDSEDLIAYQDDDLMLEETDLSSGCGFEDFIDLIESWYEFTSNR